MAISDIYRVDLDFTYKIGGVSSDEHIMTYTRKISDIFSDTNDFDTSILLAGNIDCDVFNYVNDSCFDYLMDIVSPTTSETYKTMVKNTNFKGYANSKLLGTCLIQTTNWSSFEIYNLTQKTAISGADISGGRFCLGTKTGGFKNICLSGYTSCQTDLPNPIPSTAFYSNYFSNVVTFDGIEDKTVRDIGVETKYVTNLDSETQSAGILSFDNNYRPLLTFVVLYNSDIILINVGALCHYNIRNLTTMFNTNVPIQYINGMFTDTDFIKLNKGDERPCYVKYPPTGYNNTNEIGYYADMSVSASRWYLNYCTLFNGSLARRIAVISGLPFLWSSAILSGQTLKDNLCFGIRDEYGLIPQDSYVRGYENVKKEETYNNLDYEHLTPVNPYPPIPDTDDIEPVGYGYFSNTTMGTLYALKNKLDLEKITQWLLTQTEKIDIANNVVSLKEIPFPLSTLGIEPLDTDLTIGGVNVTYQGNNVVVGEIVSPIIPTLSVVFADFDIPRLSNTFLDYAPYSKYELLVPFAPSPISLPDWVIGKNVKAIFLYDIYTTACQYVIECNGERICSVSGNFGIDRPLSAQNVALKDSARLSSQIATASSVLGGVVSGATGNIGGMISGAIGGVSALSQMILSGKQNYMYTVGANGDSSTVGLYHAAHLKITRTLSAEDENFIHIYGKPLCKVRKLSDLNGYTKCDNVNTTGLTCSESEKQMIKNLLESGVHI